MAAASPPGARVLTPHQLEELTELFQVFDVDGDGKLSMPELQDVFNCLGQGVSEAELEEIVARYTNTGALESEHFHEVLEDRFFHQHSKDAYIDALKALDSERKGGVTQDNFNKLLTAVGMVIGQEVTKSLFAKANKGLVSYADFVDAMLAHGGAMA